MILRINESVCKGLIFSQSDLEQFSRLSGDVNPIHKNMGDAMDENVLVPGMLVAARFGQILTSDFPGAGTVNIERSVCFVNPVYTGKQYTMEVRLLSVDTSEKTASLSLCVYSDTGKLCVRGRTEVKNVNVFTLENYPPPTLLPVESDNIIRRVKMVCPDSNGWEALYAALKDRRSIRFFREESISMQQLSNLLWAACGVVAKKDDTDKVFTTNPTASNHHEIQVYVFTKHDVSLYNPMTNELEVMIDEDKRKVLSNIPFVKKAPVSLCIVANLDKMVHHSDDYRRNLYSCVDTGYVSQNIYLYCAANNLATCACGMINRNEIMEALGLTNQRVMLVHPIGVRNKK